MHSVGGHGKTALHLAAEEGRIDDVKSLVEKQGAKVNAEDEDGYTPLHLVIRNSNMYWQQDIRSGNVKEVVECNIKEIVEFLVEKGANVNVTNKYESTPLHAAAYSGHEEMVKFLVENGADVNPVKHTYRGTPLHDAARHGHQEVVRYLVEQGADVDAKDECGYIPLHGAAEHNQTDTVEILLEWGVDFLLKNRNNSTPGDLTRNNKIKKLFLEKAEKGQLLYKAVENGQIDEVKALLEGGAYINIRDDGRQTPLHLAIKKGHIEVIYALLAQKG